MAKIFDHWSTIADLASEFCVPYPTAQSWVKRGFIPAHQDVRRGELIEAKGGVPDFRAFAQERIDAKAAREAAQ